jgi:hypothetical protein
MVQCLICRQCHHRYTLPPREKRRATCPRCHRRNLQKGARKGWITKARRKASRARTEGVAPGQCPTPGELAKLMEEAESKAARALELALSISRARGLD